MEMDLEGQAVCPQTPWKGPTEVSRRSAWKRATSNSLGLAPTPSTSRFFPRIRNLLVLSQENTHTHTVEPLNRKHNKLYDKYKRGRKGVGSPLKTDG